MSNKPVHGLVKKENKWGTYARTYCGVDPFRKGVVVRLDSMINAPEVSCKKCLLKMGGRA